MAIFSRRNVLFGTDSGAAAPAAVVDLPLPSDKTLLSRRNLLKGFAAAGTACAVAPAIAGLPVLDKNIPIFDPRIGREGKTVALVFDSDEDRVARGIELLLNGEVDQMVLLSFCPPDIAKKHLASHDERLRNVPIFNDPLNTSEEALAAMDWLRASDYKNVVIVGKTWHIQRCCSLLSPVANNYAITQCPVDAPIDTVGLGGERYKLGLTRIGAITRIPNYQIPWI